MWPVNAKYCIGHIHTSSQSSSRETKDEADGECLQQAPGLAGGESERVVTMAWSPGPYSRLQSHERILIFRARVRTVTDNTRLHLIFTASQLILLFPRHPFLFTISNAQNMIYASDLTNS